MRDKIELSKEERAAAIEAMRRTASDGYSFGIELDTAVDAINRVRDGDPIGTVRVSGPGVAVKFRHDQGGYGNWTVAGEDDDGGVPAYTCESDEYVASWPVVYRPGGDT